MRDGEEEEEKTAVQFKQHFSNFQCKRIKTRKNSYVFNGLLCSFGIVLYHTVVGVCSVCICCVFVRK